MTEAPKHVWLTPCETVNNKESWIDELRASHPNSYVDDSCDGVQYIRADLLQERIKHQMRLDAEDDNVNDYMWAGARLMGKKIIKMLEDLGED